MTWFAAIGQTITLLAAIFTPALIFTGGLILIDNGKDHQASWQKLAGVTIVIVACALVFAAITYGFHLKITQTGACTQ